MGGDRLAAAPPASRLRHEGMRVEKLRCEQATISFAPLLGAPRVSLDDLRGCCCVDGEVSEATRGRLVGAAALCVVRWSSVLAEIGLLARDGDPGHDEDILAGPLQPRELGAFAHALGAAVVASGSLTEAAAPRTGKTDTAGAAAQGDRAGSGTDGAICRPCLRCPDREVLAGPRRRRDDRAEPLVQQAVWRRLAWRRNLHGRRHQGDRERSSCQWRAARSVPASSDCNFCVLSLANGASLSFVRAQVDLRYNDLASVQRADADATLREIEKGRPSLTLKLSDVRLKLSDVNRENAGSVGCLGRVCSVRP